MLSSEEVVQALAQKLSEEFEATIKLTNARTGSIKVDMMLGDLSHLDYLKELSDEWVLSNIVDSILMTPEFIESCQAEDVAIDVVLDEESYQQVRSGKYILVWILVCWNHAHASIYLMTYHSDVYHMIYLRTIMIH